MRRFHHKMTFESFVLISGIVELSFLIAFQFYQVKLLTLAIKALQITIVIFICRRFMYQYNNRNGQRNSSVHNCFAITFLTFNLLFLVAILYLIVVVENYDVLIMEYVLYAHSSFGFVVCCVLFILGMLVLRVLHKSIFDPNKIKKQIDLSYSGNSQNRLTHISTAILPENEGNGANSQSDTITDSLKLKFQSSLRKNVDIHSSTRKLQLLCIVFSNVLSDSVELAIHSLRLFVFENNFIGEQHVEVNDIKGFVVYSAELFCLWLSSFANYLTFYCIVRNAFISQEAVDTIRSTWLQESNLVQYRKDENENENKDIQKYLLSNCN